MICTGTANPGSFTFHSTWTCPTGFHGPWPMDDSDRRCTTATGPADPGLFSMAMGSGRNESLPNHLHVETRQDLVGFIVKRGTGHGQLETIICSGLAQPCTVMYMKLLHVLSKVPPASSLLNPSVWKRCEVAIRLQLMGGVQPSPPSIPDTRCLVTRAEPFATMLTG